MKLAKLLCVVLLGCFALTSFGADAPKEAPDWLVSRTGLLYGYALGVTTVHQPRVIAFEGKDRPTEAGNDTSFIATRGAGLVPRGLARYDHNFALLTDGGSWKAAAGMNFILDSCKASGAFTIEALLTPSQLTLDHKGVILWFGPTTGSPNAALCQEGKTISLRLRTVTDGVAAESRTDLLQWPDAQPHHLAVTYANGVLTTYLDGKQASRSEAVKGDLSRWRASELIFGDDFQATANWPGKLEAIAFYGRALDAAEVQQQNDRCRAILAARKEPKRVRLIATLTAPSETPDPAKIEPYYQALSVYEYKVVEVKEGVYTDPTVCVAHWVIMDKQKLPIATRPIGTKVELLLEPYDANPQLETDFWLMDNVNNADIPLMYDLNAPQK